MNTRIRTRSNSNPNDYCDYCEITRHTLHHCSHDDYIRFYHLSMIKISEFQRSFILFSNWLHSFYVYEAPNNRSRSNSGITAENQNQNQNPNPNVNHLQYNQTHHHIFNDHKKLMKCFSVRFCNGYLQEEQYVVVQRILNYLLYNQPNLFQNTSNYQVDNLFHNDQIRSDQEDQRRRNETFERRRAFSYIIEDYTDDQRLDHIQQYIQEFFPYDPESQYQEITGLRNEGRILYREYVFQLERMQMQDRIRHEPILENLFIPNPGSNTNTNPVKILNEINIEPNLDHEPTDFDCPICLSTCSKASHVLLSCTHDHCATCLQSWLQTNKTTCSLCRSQITKITVQNSVTKNLFIPYCISNSL
jgi:hypothetical protein